MVSTDEVFRNFLETPVLSRADKTGTSLALYYVRTITFFVRCPCVSCAHLFVLFWQRQSIRSCNTRSFQKSRPTFSKPWRKTTAFPRRFPSSLRLKRWCNHRAIKPHAWSPQLKNSTERHRQPWRSLWLALPLAKKLFSPRRYVSWTCVPQCGLLGYHMGNQLYNICEWSSLLKGALRYWFLLYSDPIVAFPNFVSILRFFWVTINTRLIQVFLVDWLSRSEISTLTCPQKPKWRRLWSLSMSRSENCVYIVNTPPH